MATKIRLLERINLSKKLACHVKGEEHTTLHRRCAGLFIIIIAVSISELLHLTPFAVIHFFGKALEASFTGIGVIPFIEGPEHKVANQENTTTPQEINIE